MAKKRSFNLSVLLEEALQSLPYQTRWLYVLLNFEADNDGFIRTSEYVLRTSSCTEQDLEALISAGYLLRFESGVLLIKHWIRHNSVRPSRRGTTMFKEEWNLVTPDVSGLYRLKSELLEEHQDVSPEGSLNVGQKDIFQTQKKRKQSSKPETSHVKSPPRFVPPSLDEVKDYIREHKYQVDAEKWYSYYESNGWMVGKNKMKSWQACLQYWEHNDFGGKKNDSSGIRRKNKNYAGTEAGFQYYDE